MIRNDCYEKILGAKHTKHVINHPQTFLLNKKLQSNNSNNIIPIASNPVFDNCYRNLFTSSMVAELAKVDALC